jgi:hypothetical protein
LGKALAMGYLSADLPAGSPVTVTGTDGTGVEGLTTDRPFYDPDGARVHE